MAGLTPFQTVGPYLHLGLRVGRGPMTAPENGLPLTITLPTPAQGDVAVLRSTRAAGESGGAPAMIAAAPEDPVSIRASMSAWCWRARPVMT